MGHSYRDLIVWQKAIAMVTDIYRATQNFPRQETYGLTSQIRRSAVSVASNSWAWREDRWLKWKLRW